MNYKVVENSKTSYSVYETKTEQVIKEFNTRSDARKLMKTLNLGNGFDSWTPTFFLKPFKVV